MYCKHINYNGQRHASLHHCDTNIIHYKFRSKPALQHIWRYIYWFHHRGTDTWSSPRGGWNICPGMLSTGTSCRPMVIKGISLFHIFTLLYLRIFWLFMNPSFDGRTAEVDGTIMVPCVPVCCNKVIGIIMVPMLHILTFHNPPPPLMAELPKSSWWLVCWFVATNW